MARPVRFPDIDDELRQILDANMDEAPARRRARLAFKDIQLGIDHILFKVIDFNFEFIHVFVVLTAFQFIVLCLFDGGDFILCLQTPCDGLKMKEVKKK